MIKNLQIYISEAWLPGLNALWDWGNRKRGLCVLCVYVPSITHQQSWDRRKGQADYLDSRSIFLKVS